MRVPAPARAKHENHGPAAPRAPLYFHCRFAIFSFPPLPSMAYVLDPGKYILPSAPRPVALKCPRKQLGDASARRGSPPSRDNLRPGPVYSGLLLHRKLTTAPHSHPASIKGANARNIGMKRFQGWRGGANEAHIPLMALAADLLRFRYDRPGHCAYMGGGGRRRRRRALRESVT